MTSTPEPDGPAALASAGDESELLQRARAGSHGAFERAVAPYVEELRRHCYRMTASVDDADDILQETLFRAWRGLGGFQGRSSFRGWLFRIATNRSLDVTSGRAWRDPNTDASDFETEPPWLQPFPTASFAADDPADAAVERDAIGLAYLVALQSLPPRQRAAVILTEVLGFSSAEAAHILETTPASVNSALQRARASLPLGRPHRASIEEATVVERFVDRWNARDLAGVVALLADDVRLSMPPDPLIVDGATQYMDFLSGVLDGDWRNGRLLVVEANGQLGATLYGPILDDPLGLHGIMLFHFEGPLIRHIVGFPRFPALDHFVDLPPSLVSDQPGSGRQNSS